MGKVALAVAMCAALVLGAAPASADDGLGMFNEGQSIIFRLPRPVAISFGEAAYTAPALQSAFFDIARYTLSSQGLAGASIWCYRWTAGSGATDHCHSMRIVLSPGTLSEGRRYVLALDGEALASFIAAGLNDHEPPSVVAVQVQQFNLEITFSERMRLEYYACGDGGYLSGGSGTLNGPEGYSSDDPGYQQSIRGFFEIETSEDCTTIALFGKVGAKPGSYTLIVEGIEDVAGNPLPRTEIPVTIEDEGPPGINSVLSHTGQDRLSIGISEPLNPATVTDPGGYRLNDRPLPPGSAAGCGDTACSLIVLFLPQGTIRMSEMYAITLLGPRDLVGNPVGPENRATFRG